MMPKFKCVNKDCSMFDVEQDNPGGRITIVNGKAFDKNQACPTCGKNRIVVREPGMTTFISGTNDQLLRNQGHI